MTLEQLLNAHAEQMQSVVPFEPGSTKLVHLDFSKANPEIAENMLDDINRFTHYVLDKLEDAGAQYGIGGYGEERVVYGGSEVFDGSGGKEPRRIHLGIDIWGAPHTKVMAPLRGIVHSFAFNNGFGDYGATVILSHNLEGIAFHTLYGHLSLNSLKDLEEGQTILPGDVFAEFGTPEDNGHWPPHLHFQIIEDLGSWKGDYPGVCAASEKEKYFANCPDPDLVLNMMKYAAK